MSSGSMKSVGGVGVKLLGGEEAGGDPGVAIGESVSGAFHRLVAIAGPAALPGHGGHRVDGGLPYLLRTGSVVSGREVPIGVPERVLRRPGVLAGRLGNDLPVGVQQGEHSVDELAHQAAVVGQLVPLHEAFIEPGAELLGHGKLVAQVVVAGLAGQAFRVGSQVLQVAGGPAARIRYCGQGMGRGVPQVVVGQQRLLVLEVLIGRVEESLGDLGGVLSEHERLPLIHLWL